MGMEQFKISEAGISELKKSMMAKAVPFAVMAVLGGGLMAYFNRSEGQGSLPALLLVIPVFGVLIVIGLSRALNMQKTILESYRFSIDENYVRRKQNNTPDINIPLGEISAIVKHPNGNIIIKGRSANDIIGILAQTEDYCRLESRLSEVMPIVQKTHVPFFQRFQILLLIPVMLFMAGVFIAENIIVVGICGIVLLGVLVWSFFIIQKDRNLDEKTRKASRWIFLVMASIVGIMYLKLTGKS